MPKAAKLKMILDSTNMSIQYPLKHKQDIMHKLFKLVLAKCIMHK